MRKSLLTILVLLGLSSTVFGFATIVTSIKGGDTITFTSNVDDVNVLLEGTPIGKIRNGSLTYKLKRDGDDKIVTFKKDGYKTQESKITTQFDNMFWGNIVVGGSFGSSTDSWSTHSTKQFTPNQFYIEMEKAK